MKWWFSIGCLLIGLAMMVASCETPTTSPRPSPGGEEVDSPALTGTPSQRGTEDSLKEYYERMERWRVLHGGMSRWESDK